MVMCLILKRIFTAGWWWFNTVYLDFNRCTNNHCLFQEFSIERWRMVIHVDDGDKDFSQAVFALWIFCLDVKVVFRPHLCIQGGPGLCGDETRRWVDGKPAKFSQFSGWVITTADIVYQTLFQVSHDVLWICAWLTWINYYKKIWNLCHVYFNK